MITTSGTASATETTTTTTSRTPIAEGGGSSYLPKNRPNQRQSLRLSTPSHSSAQTIRFSASSSSPSPSRSHGCTYTALPPTSVSANLSRFSNVPPDIASIIHTTYMSSALQSSRLARPTLSDLWNQSVSSNSSCSSSDGNS